MVEWKEREKERQREKRGSEKEGAEKKKKRCTEDYFIFLKMSIHQLINKIK